MTALPVLGIDLGTTNSVVAAVIDGRVQVLPDASGNYLHPSAVAFVPSGEVLIGEPARARRIIDPANTVISSKRIIGRAFHSPASRAAIAQLPYEVAPGPNEEPLILTRAGAVAVTDIATMMLTHCRNLAQAYLERSIEACVVTVPANFSDAQRQATRAAASRAGMEVLRVLNEPTAAALAYGATRSGGHERIAVFDLGGGTFDLTVLAVRDDLYEVLATGGESYLGGDDFDQALAELLAMQALRELRVDLRADPLAWPRLVADAERIKLELTRAELASGVLEEIGYGPGGKPLALHYRITRAELEAAIAPHISRAIDCAAAVLAEAAIAPSAIDTIILVGGSTLIPAVYQHVGQLFGRRPQLVVNPMQVVAAGAALHAQALYDPDPTRARGLLMDVTSHALGIATTGGFAEALIAKNTPIPAEGVRAFTTAHDGQDQVRIRICQGESRIFEENTLLGELRLSKLRPARRGEVTIDVSFLVDANGILQVAARDAITGQTAAATLEVLGVTTAEEL